MSDPEVRTSHRETSKHRHSWAVAWDYKVPCGRTKQELRCRFCQARKGQFVKKEYERG